ncbi:CapA family protein [Ideonella sp. TBM-1]|uniref:CapA family protein n=2 Tax=Ideonella livida TaxID=2707176 RepID=A0A7C9PF70_9BURK|nr:CapA family protein [Ideonella livida]
MRDGELRYRCQWPAVPTLPPVRRLQAPLAVVPLDPAVPERTLSPAQAQALRATPAPAGARVTLAFAGDLMLDDGPGRLIAAGGDPLAPFDALLRAADVRIGNLELPVSTRGEALASKIFVFRAPPQALRVLQGRFDAVAVANNHSGDYGKQAFADTLSHSRAAGLVPFGGGANLREAHRPLWIERQGLRIAVLAYSEFKPRSFAAGPDWPGIAWSEDTLVEADIRAARAAGAHVVIPFMHWGWEREPQPEARQRALARRMIAAGADAVVGGHPHVTQGADIIDGKPVIWSLGNFVFDGFDLPAAKVGWLLRLTVDAQGVQAWDTVAARMDEQGTPHPDPALPTPCGRRGQARVGECTPLR